MLHYKISGNGTACVFLHGFLESMSMWDYLPLKDLPCRKVFIDLPGHGDSTLEDTKEPSIDFMAESVKSILDKEGIEEFNVVGHSMGGYVALLLKEKMLKCQKVILLNSNYWSDIPSKKKDRDRVSKIAFKAKDYFLQEAIPNLFSDRKKFVKEINHLLIEAKQMTPEAVSYASLAMKNRRDMSALLNSNDFVLIHGELDGLVDKSSYNIDLINPIHFHNVRAAGHMSHIENHGGVIDVLKLYLID